MEDQSIRNELKALEEIARRSKRSLEKAPQGSLTISNCRGHIQYYHRVSKAKRVYIPSSNIALAKSLAQKSYDLKISQTVLSEINLLENFLQNYRADTPSNETPSARDADSPQSPSAKKRTGNPRAKEASSASSKHAYCLMIKGAERLQRRPLPLLASVKAIYEQLPPERKTLVNPYVTPDADYASQWESREPDPEHTLTQPGTLATEKGDLVRSKSEVIIADRLYRAGVPYHYEQPIRIGDKGTILHPDFVVLNPATRQEIIWEHFGLMDNADYVANALSKINAYATCGLLPGDGLIVTFESAGQPLSLPMVSAIVSSLTSSNLPAKN